MSLQKLALDLGGRRQFNQVWLRTRLGLLTWVTLRRRLERGLAAIVAHPLPICLLSLAVPFLTSFVHAHRAPLRHDEFYTAYLSRLPDWHSVWQALNEGTDVTPPLFMLITRASTQIFGSGNLGLRLPGLLGGWLMIWCVYRFMRNVVPPTHACLAALTLVFTLAFERYFCNARPYGLLLGATGIALLGWQKRSALVVGLALGAATGLQYFALTLVGPFALAEGARWWKERQLSMPMLVALLVPLAIVLAHWPLIPLAAQTYGVDIEYTPSYRGVLTIYGFWFGPLIMPLVLTLVTWELCRLSGVVSVQAIQPQAASYTSCWHWALALGLAALPGLTIIVVALTFQIFLRHYTIAGVIGVGLLVGLSAARLDRRCHSFGSVTLLVFAASTLYTGIQYRRTVAPLTLPPALQVELRASSDPVLINHRAHYLSLQDNAPPDLRARLWYAYDLDIVRLHYQLGIGKADAQENGIRLLGKWAPLNIIAFQQFLASHPTFLVYGTPDEGWLLRELKRRQAVITLLSWHGPRQLYRCHFPKIEMAKFAR